MEKRECKYCLQQFDFSGKVFSNHVRWCDKNPNRNNTDNIKIGVKLWRDKKLGKLKDFEVACSKCKKKFSVKEREKRHPEKKKYYCCRSCANSRKKSKRLRNKISATMKGMGLLPRQPRTCLECNREFDVSITSKRKFCSNPCRIEYFRSSNEYLTYKSSCQFKFNVWQYPKEFNLDLIRKHGWYKASNRGNNLGGVSRDHKISIRYGWENGILAEVMSHPANCQLMVHTENQRKNKKCSILLKQLLVKISDWNFRYITEDH